MVERYVAHKTPASPTEPRGDNLFSRLAKRTNPSKRLVITFAQNPLILSFDPQNGPDFHTVTMI